MHANLLPRARISSTAFRYLSIWLKYFQQQRYFFFMGLFGDGFIFTETWAQWKKKKEVPIFLRYPSTRFTTYKMIQREPQTSRREVV